MIAKEPVWRKSNKTDSGKADIRLMNTQEELLRWCQEQAPGTLMSMSPTFLPPELIDWLWCFGEPAEAWPTGTLNTAEGRRSGRDWSGTGNGRA